MDFNNFTINKKVNPVIDSSTEEVRGKLILPKQDITLVNNKQVYQGCTTCKRETNHYIIGNIVRCMYCKSEYKLN